MSLFSLQRFTADFDVTATFGQLDTPPPASKKTPVQLVPNVDQGAAREHTTMIRPCSSLASARQAALDLALRWGQSKRRESNLLFVSDHPDHLPANDQAALDAAVDANTAAVVLDSACEQLSADYCQAAAQLCRALHILLIIDGSADCPSLVTENAWGIEADIVIVDHDRLHGFVQPALVVRTQTDGLEPLIRLRGPARSQRPQSAQVA